MIEQPSLEVYGAARARLASLAVPTGALGRLGDLAVWWSSVRGEVAAPPPSRVRAVIFAGDHGVAAYGVSAYPATVTPAMVRAFAAGQAGVSVLARQHDVHLRVLDISVDADFDDLDPSVSAFKVRRGTEPIHLRDAMTTDQTEQAIDVGARIAAEEIAAGADLLIGGDMGIGNTTTASALIAANMGLSAQQVVGRGTGIDDDALDVKRDVLATAIERAGARVFDPVDRLTALGSPDIAAQAGFICAAAKAGVPVLLDGIVSTAAAGVAERLQPGASRWLAAGTRSTEKAQVRALEKLGRPPLLDLGLRLGEGSGAVAAVPLVRSAALLLAETARLDEVL